MKQLLAAIYETVNDRHIDNERKIELIKVLFEVAEDNHDLSNLNPFDESKAMKIKAKVSVGKEFPFTEIDLK